MLLDGPKRTDDPIPLDVFDIAIAAEIQTKNKHILVDKAHFIRRIPVVSNAIQTIDIMTAYLIIYCSNCIRRDGN